MSSILKIDTDLSQMKCWPIGGFAPGGYQCKCTGCGANFPADKRASECLECAINGVKQRVEKLATDYVTVSNEAVMVQETIVAAAIQVEGVTISLPKPARHGQVIHAAEAMQLPRHMITPACQGFITSEGRFVNRVMAKQIAHRAGQRQLRSEAERHDRDLFSEDLW